MRLSILICSLRSRERFLARLLAVLHPQCVATDKPIEILMDDRGHGVSIGVKRNALLQRASGDYVAFCDDDDLVSDNYVELVLNALSGDPDCAELRGIYTVDGQNPEPFWHTIACKEWHKKDGIYMRMPNHLNAIRRELALKAGFPDNSFGEDHEFSKRVQPLLKTQGAIAEPIYRYLYRSKK